MGTGQFLGKRLLHIMAVDASESGMSSLVVLAIAVAAVLMVGATSMGAARFYGLKNDEATAVLNETLSYCSSTES